MSRQISRNILVNTTDRFVLIVSLTYEIKLKLYFCIRLFFSLLNSLLYPTLIHLISYLISYTSIPIALQYQSLPSNYRIIHKNSITFSLDSNTATLHHSGCKLDIGFKYSFRMIGYLLVACLTADRYVAVRRPMDALRWCRARRAAYTCLLLCGVSFFLALPAFLLGKRNPRKPYACALYSTQSNLVAAYMFLVPLGCNLITFAFVLGANVAIVWSIRRRLKYRGVCERHLAMGFTRRPLSDTNRLEAGITS